MSLSKQITKNFIWLMSGEGLKAGSGMVLVIILARTLDPSGFGRYIFAAAVAQLMLIIADFGFFTYLINKIAPNREKLAETVNNILSFKLFIALVYFIILGFTIFSAQRDPLTSKIIFLLSLSGLLETFTQVFYAVFRAQENMRLENVFKISASIFNLLLICCAVLLKQGVLIIFYAFLMEKIISLLVVGGYYLKKNKIKFSYNYLIWRKILIEVWPISVTIFLVLVYYNINQYIIGQYLGDQETGWYGAMYKLYFILIIINAAYFNTLYPMLARFNVSAKEQMLKILKQSIMLITFLYIPLITFGIFFSQQIITIIFGVNYLPGQRTLIFMLLSLILLGWNCIFNNTLLACNYKVETMKILAFAVITDVLLCFLLIPMLGIVGGAISILGAECVSLVAGIYYFRKKISSLAFIWR